MNPFFNTVPHSVYGKRKLGKKKNYGFLSAKIPPFTLLAKNSAMLTADRDFSHYYTTVKAYLHLRTYTVSARTLKDTLACPSVLSKTMQQSVSL